ncbi:MAG TPA: DNA-deoxyinosine glycosylase, partial [Rubrivivax sp.]|nr:DNA-deoxyinosine glycosylase [Rubrivivax sp.]
SLRRRAPGLVLVAHNGAESARSMPLVRALGLQAVRLPSSSPANASWSFERKLEAWRAAFASAGA